MIDLVLLQLTDLFRIALITGLVYTMHRTAAVTGHVLPLVLGVVFVAVLLPATQPTTSVTFTDAILAGLVSNTIILLPVLVVSAFITRKRR